MRYRLIVAYDGTDFSGWQVQKHIASVAQTMQDRFKILFNRDITLIGASRTDAGVHALGQVAAFSADLSIDTSLMMNAWNDALPETIVIRSLEHAQEVFHPIYGVAQKTYRYRFFLERPLPFVERYGWFFRYQVDLELLQEALQLFVGTHDFRSFCTGVDMGENTIRTIESIELHKEEASGSWQITVKGPGFLRHMIRRIVGASLDVASKKKVSVARLKAILEEKNPEQALTNAPAKGLCLDSIVYKKCIE